MGAKGNVRPKAGGQSGHADREELIARLHYDRADAARFDTGAARTIDLAIAMLMGEDVAAQAADGEPASETGGRLH